MTATADVAADILLVTVQYGNFADTSALVASLSAADDVATLEMVIVDNLPSNDAGDLESLRDGAPFTIHILRPGANLYYWGGASRALEVVRSANDRKHRWTIVCNNDVLIGDPSFFRRLRALDVNRFPIVAPAIMHAGTGRDQNPLLATVPHGLKRLKWRVHDLHYRIAQSMLWVNRVIRRMTNGSVNGAYAAEQRIYAPHGAFVILSCAFFDKGGALDTTLSMYAEELSLAATAERLGLPVWHRPDLRVVHNPHSTTGVSLTREKYQMEREARQHYYKLIADGRTQSMGLTETNENAHAPARSDSMSRQ
jgi:GT2 family glycosyltransferase